MKETGRQTWASACQELSAYFGSPLALIFVGAFLVVTLFAFFWSGLYAKVSVAELSQRCTVAGQSRTARRRLPR
jgi:hypothetical protein